MTAAGRWRAAALVAAVVLAVPACSGGSGGSRSSDDAASPAAPGASSSPSSAPGGSARGEAPPASVPDLLDVRAPAVGGGEVDLAEYAGEALALWFWAPW